MNKIKENQKYKIFRHKGETTIHFNPDTTPLSEDELNNTEGVIQAKSGGRIDLIAKHAKYGILYIQEDTSVSPSTSITVDEAIKMVVGKITKATVVV